MARTTPPRPVNMAEVFPELAGMTRTTTRLHPRRGDPTVERSSIGGPLLWPVEEPWPHCHDCHHNKYRFAPELTSLHEVRAARGLATGEPCPLSAADLETLRRSREGVPVAEHALSPMPLLPVAQLYATEIPDLLCPPGADLLQVLWCPFDHEDDYTPNVWLYWRRAADIEQVLLEPPEPALVVDEEFVPHPCVLDPERVIEFPPSHLIPQNLAERIREWEQERHMDYDDDLSIPPGWKVGGWESMWTFCDPIPLGCEQCGADVEPLLMMEGGNFTSSWRAVEDNAELGEVPDPESHPGVRIGRGYTLQIYCCSRDRRHPCVTAMQ
ncbi:hypothetical protein J2S53_000814 [Actinopolyspora lacussalsi]|nr:hypothetical protein [Actinopolyspora lacussalsi]